MGNGTAVALCGAQFFVHEGAQARAVAVSSWKQPRGLSMSEHEIEDLVEASVRAIGRAGDRLPARTARDLIANLYRIQRAFEGGPTQDRVRDILEAQRFVLRLKVEDHPDAARLPALFAHIKKSNARCTLHEARRWDGARGMYVYYEYPAASYVAWSREDAIVVRGRRRFTTVVGEGTPYLDGELLCEVGSRLWRRLRETGAVDGLDAQEPTEMPPHRVALQILEQAERQGDLRLLSWWYAALPYIVDRLGEPGDLRALADYAEVASLLRIIRRTRAYESRTTLGLMPIPRESDVASAFAHDDIQDFARAWYALDWQLPPLHDRAELVSATATTLRASLEGGARPGEALAAALDELSEVSDWAVVRTLVARGFRYAPADVERKLRLVADWSSGRPILDRARADSELALQMARPRRQRAS
jgi:hypothetical protein